MFFFVGIKITTEYEYIYRGMDIILKQRYETNVICLQYVWTNISEQKKKETDLVGKYL